MGSLLFVLRACFPPQPECPIGFLLAASGALWLIWHAVGTAITHHTVLGLTGESPGLGETFAAGFVRLPRVISVPIFVLSGTALLAALPAGLLQVVRIPVVGWPLAVVLLPVVLLLFGGAVSILLRALLTGHLAAVAAVIEGEGGFVALTRSFAYLRRNPIRVLLLRIAGPLIALLLSLPRLVVQLLAAGAAYGVLSLTAPAATARLQPIFLGLFGAGSPPASFAAFAVVLVSLLLAAWVAGGLLAAVFGVRAGQYLLFRRRLDGVEHDALLPARPREKTLEELGAELIESLDAPVDGPRP
jgi:hypothetical protein